MNVAEALFQLRDQEYKAFQCKLMPTVDPDCVIGIRTPVLRKFAERLPAEEACKFMSCLPHRYYEENNMHAFLIEKIKDVDACLSALDQFLPYVDNWATCDSMRPKCLCTDKRKLLEYVRKWLADPGEYVVRFGIGMLMCHFFDDEFEPSFLQMVASVERDDYYIKMMIAWYFATALAKQYDYAVDYLKRQCLSLWVHNKTIQKAVDSYRITDKQKAYLKTLRRRV